jgi:uncharacterized protein YjbI with pentapeptide repeats
MANPEHLEILKQGVGRWNRWRKTDDVFPDLSDTDLSKMQLDRADFYEANLTRTKFIKASLRGVIFDEANLFEANLEGADLTSFTSESRSNFAIGYPAILSEANLKGANLSYAELAGANLLKANLSGANLSRASLDKADLTGAKFIGADLTQTIFTDAKLGSAKFGRAKVFSTDFTNADLKGASFLGSDLDGARFGDNDLSLVNDLESIIHLAPSVIGINTLSRSKGSIPEAFLRGCGLKDWEIEAIKLYGPHLSPGQATDILYKVVELRTNPAIQFSSCFISYSSKNYDFAERLYADLQNKGVRCWFAPEDMKIGDKLRPRIDETIRIHDKLLLVLSADSVASQWVEQEVETALEKEREHGRTVLFPIRLDDAVMEIKTGWPALIKNTRNIGDFSQWKDHDSYQKAFNRLLRDLKAESAA